MASSYLRILPVHHARPDSSPALNMVFAANNTNSEDEGGGESAQNPCLLLSSTTTVEKLEKTAKMAEDMDKEERRRRFLELKLAREKAQRHLESLAKKNKEKEDEVMLGLKEVTTF